MFTFLHKYGSPQHFYRLSRGLAPWFGGASALLFAAGLYGALLLSPPDYQQGEGVRIIYVHVPSAWMSLMVYVIMAAAGGVGLIWKVKVADAFARASAPLGAAFTFLALATGSLWGKPMWGTWWVWDARLTSELILLFLYLGYMALQTAIEDRRTAARAGAVLALVGLVNIPIIHFSVLWWSTLHQGPTLRPFAPPAIHMSMLVPLMVMAVAFMLYFAAVVLVRTRNELLELERNSNWARELAAEEAAR
ncbi:MAG: heme ABC transporter permease [Gammaproteobacteria bacterium]|nr:heme ABC transporter permease [Gammaproteobacteria bacterium]